jgi:predicted flavoprotein YhiN
MENPLLYLDLKPTFSSEDLESKINSLTSNYLDHAVQVWRLAPSAATLLRSASNRLEVRDPLSLARLAKNLPIPVIGPRPIEEAISSAGGVSFDELDESLMVKRYPGLFLAGEMIDWEAPTGGYLLQGCLSTGTRAAQGALSYLKNRS